MANPYTPIDGGEPLSYWQERMNEEARAREAAARAAWSYPYILSGSITQQSYDTRTTGTTFSPNGELQFVARPGNTYSIQGYIHNIGSPNTARASGVTFAISGTQTGNTYHTNGFIMTSTTGPLTYFSGASFTFSSTTSGNTYIGFTTTVEVANSVLAWEDGLNPPTIGVWWNLGPMTSLSNATSTMRWGNMSWHTTTYPSGVSGFTAQR